MNQKERDIPMISNELEFPLYGVTAASLIPAYNAAVLIDGKYDSSAVHEVNPEHIVEVNLSKARDIAELNDMVSRYVPLLIMEAGRLGGFVYAGSSVLEDVSRIDPKWHRTTSLSRRCADGFKDITSQQVVLGVSNEQLGMDLYNLFREIGPALIALTASSPYTFGTGDFLDTKTQSRRINQYEKLCANFPPETWRDLPVLNSLAEYHAYMRHVSDSVNQRLAKGQMDENHEELYRVRNRDDGSSFSHAPFDLLEPHQIFLHVRPRPDHAVSENGRSCLLSTEVRVPDIATTIDRMQGLNSFVVGLAYYVADHGPVTNPFSGSFDQLKRAARYGLDDKVGRFGMRKIISDLRDYAYRGLNQRGFNNEAILFGDDIDNVLVNGNDADLIRKLRFSKRSDLRNYLINRLGTRENL